MSRDITDGILGIKVANREHRAFRRISLSPGRRTEKDAGELVEKGHLALSAYAIVAGFSLLSLLLSVCSHKYL